MSAYWMPFTANRYFEDHPRILTSAQGMYYFCDDGRRILDAASGLWCVNAGHGRREIIAAICDQAARLDYSPAFQVGHPGAFTLAERLADLLPGDLNHVFFTNSGSEAVETALKIALAYHHGNGETGRSGFVSRQRGYHGVNFGGISVGGIATNKDGFGAGLSGIDHLVHTHNLEKNAFSKGQGDWGGHLADDLERIIAERGADTIAAVIVEPMAGSTGVLIPPKGYLERLREICDTHGLLLIFDEVITGFGRMGASFASQVFGVTPDLITLAKGLTNGAVPMGAVGVRQEIYQSFMERDLPSAAVELFHGYTYSGHPLACAAALASLDIYRDEKLFARAGQMARPFESAAHGLKDLGAVIDIRNFGMVAAIELEPIKDKPGARAFEVYLRCFEKGLLIRTTGETIALSPPLIISDDEIARIFEILGEAIKDVA